MIATRAVLPAVVVQNFKTENVLVDLASEGSLRTGGASVIIGGLQGEQAVLNGRRATVVKDEGADLVAGAAVRMFGLTGGKAQLNGMTGSVSAKVAPEGCVSVDLPLLGATLGLQARHATLATAVVVSPPLSQSVRPVADA